MRGSCSPREPSSHSPCYFSGLDASRPRQYQALRMWRLAETGASRMPSSCAPTSASICGERFGIQRIKTNTRFAEPNRVENHPRPIVVPHPPRNRLPDLRPTGSALALTPSAMSPTLAHSPAPATAIEERERSNFPDRTRRL